MTTQDKIDAELNKLPAEFRSAVSYAAYERGHAYGYEEILSHVRGYVEMLEEPICKFRDNLQTSWRNSQRPG